MKQLKTNRGMELKLWPSVFSSDGILKEALGLNCCQTRLISGIIIVKKGTNRKIHQCPHILKVTI